MNCFRMSRTKCKSCFGNKLHWMQWVTMSALSFIKCKSCFGNKLHWMQWVTMSAISCKKCKIYFSNVFHWLQWVALSAGSELHLLGMSCIEFNKLHRVQDLIWELVALNAMSLSQCNELQLLQKLHWVSFIAMSCTQCNYLHWMKWVAMSAISCNDLLWVKWVAMSSMSCNECNKLV